MEDKRQPTTVTHMLSDPMWSLDHNIVVDKIAKSVAEEPLEPGANMEDVPQHVIDEERGDMIRQRRKEQAQMEMYDDPYLNWSGHR